MKHNSVLSVSFLLLLLVIVGTVRASTGVFVIDPSKEVTQNVECASGVQSIAGNVSVVGGKIDLYITDPSWIIVLRYENISILDFNVRTAQNGTYVIHMANRLATDNVTATLYYGMNFSVVFNEQVRTWQTISTWTMTTSTITPPFQWAGPLSQIVYVVFTVILGPVLAGLILDELRRRVQKWKDGESKTPVVVK